MKILTAISAAAPASAQGMMMHGGMMRGGMAHGGGTALLLAVALYAVLASLGYWVLQHSAKETAAQVKRAGTLVGWALIALGLLGAVCGIANHARMAHWARCEMCRGEAPGSGGMEKGPIMRSAQTPEELPAKPETAPAVPVAAHKKK